VLVAVRCDASGNDGAEVTAPQIFIICWGVLATALGALFAFRPDLVVRLYRWNLKNYPLGERLRSRMQPKPYVATFYRVAGIAAMILGVTIGTLALVGVIRPVG
jgi:hypothetical protein